VNDRFAFVFSNMLAMVATGAPVSIAVELAVLAISALRSFFGSRRCGLLLASDFCFMHEL